MSATIQELRAAFEAAAAKARAKDSAADAAKSEWQEAEDDAETARFALNAAWKAYHKAQTEGVQP